MIQESDYFVERSKYLHISIIARSKKSLKEPYLHVSVQQQKYRDADH